MLRDRLSATYFKIIDLGTTLTRDRQIPSTHSKLKMLCVCFPEYSHTFIVAKANGIGYPFCARSLSRFNSLPCCVAVEAEKPSLVPA